MKFKIEDTIGNSAIVGQNDGSVVASVRLYGNVHEQKVFNEGSVNLAIAKATSWIVTRHFEDSKRTDFSFIEIRKEYLIN
jgi:hypothetical protein